MTPALADVTDSIKPIEGSPASRRLGERSARESPDKNERDESDVEKNDLKKACESKRGRLSVEGTGWLNAGSRVWRAAFFVCLIAVLVLSLLPGRILPPIDTGWDKTNHWLAYFVLGLLGLRAWPGRTPSVFVALVAYGGAIEVLQGMSDYRSAEWLDLLADVIGLLGAALVGMVVGLVVFARSRRRLRACGGVRVEYRIDGGRVAATPDARVRVKGDREASAQQARENFRMFGAPHVAIVSSPAELGIYGAIDCGAYVANFMLAAESLGVSTIAQAALASYPDIARRELGTADDRVIVCGISFGYADAKHCANSFRTERANLDETVVWVDQPAR